MPSVVSELILQLPIFYRLFIYTIFFQVLFHRILISFCAMSFIHLLTADLPISIFCLKPSISWLSHSRELCSFSSDSICPSSFFSFCVLFCQNLDFLIASSAGVFPAGLFRFPILKGKKNPALTPTHPFPPVFSAAASFAAASISADLTLAGLMISIL